MPCRWLRHCWNITSQSGSGVDPKCPSPGCPEVDVVSRASGLGRDNFDLAESLCVTATERNCVRSLQAAPLQSGGPPGDTQGTVQSNGAAGGGEPHQPNVKHRRCDQKSCSPVAGTRGSSSRGRQPQPESAAHKCARCLRHSGRLERGNLPYFELEFSVAINHLKVGTVRGDEPGSMRSSRERDEYVEMQVAKLVGREPCAHVNLPEYMARLQPIFFRGRQYGMVSLQGSQKFALRRLRGTTPQFGQYHRRCPDETSD